MENLNTLPDDMTQEEKNSLQDYINNGCPGFLKVQESDIFKWFGLYMSGKTYDEIAKITKSKRDLVLYLSYKSKWNEKRLKHYEDLTQSLTQKVEQGKLDSANTIVSMISALNRYYGDKFNQFLALNDKSIIENIDPRMLAQYYKSMDTLKKLLEDNVPSDLERKLSDKDNKKEEAVEVTEEKVGNILQILANYKKSSKDT